MQSFKGQKDFSTFRSASCNARSPIKTIEQAKVIKKQDIIRIIFKSKSFLQQKKINGRLHKICW